MNFLPTFYFRPLDQPIILSHAYGIKLYNPSPNDIPILEQSLESLSSVLSQKEKRRILYTLYPLGVKNPEGSLDEIFIRELTKIWVLVSTSRSIPLEEELLDYGFLLGYLSDNTFCFNPMGFVMDIRRIHRREVFRALKKELPKAAQLLMKTPIQYNELKDLSSLGAKWDGILGKQQQKFKIFARSLRKAHFSNNMQEKFFQLCLAAESLLVSNPTDTISKYSMSKQFANKLALVRHLGIRKQQENILQTPTDMQSFFTKVYDTRSRIVHGRGTVTHKEIAELLKVLYPSIRLLAKLQTEDPHLIDFIYLT